jgi:hypothetical protein
MCSEPGWLPPMAQVSPWQYGDGRDTYEMLYAIFHRDFVISRPQYAARDVWYFPNHEDGKETIFWHLTSRDEKSKPVPRRMRGVVGAANNAAGRYPDLRRSERLPWVRSLIANSIEPEVLTWDYLEGDGSIRTYIWLKNFDFVVIMKKYPKGGHRLITSFYVDEDYKRSDFAQKYAHKIP